MQLTDEEITDLTVSLNSLRIALNQQGIFFPSSDIEESIFFCITHHYQHIKRLQVAQISIDPYKIITWFGIDLAGKDERKREISQCTIAALNGCLIEEKPVGESLGADTLQYIAQLTENELNGTENHGIGKNGLFAAFHCAQKMKLNGNC